MNEYLITCNLVYGCYAKSYFAVNKQQAIKDFKKDNDIKRINKSNFYITNK